MQEKNLRILPRFIDGLSFLYVEHANVERKDRAIAVYTSEGATQVPCASLAVLALGPGTRITHSAMVALAESGACVQWVGEDASRFYAQGSGKTRKSTNTLRQAAAWSDRKIRVRVVELLYRLRFHEELPPALNLQQIRGKEGARVRDAYARASVEFGVEWHGRSYNRESWATADPINRALSAGASLLYGVCHSGIVAAGYSPAIGFIHVGKQLSFVYDIADLYKIDLLVPAAFKAVSECFDSPERAVRLNLREAMSGFNLLPRIIGDLGKLFDREILELEMSSEVDSSDSPGAIWDPSGLIRGGQNHAGDDT